jgi:hypothetical protein
MLVLCSFVLIAPGVAAPGVFVCVHAGGGASGDSTKSLRLQIPKKSCADSVTNHGLLLVL